nr:LacI family DNA-binding transcriptional regulator [uncultured Schaedlerella sp.]
MATINDIAKMAGVSISTVSHVVNKTRYVSPEKVEKVEKAIRELDNLPNFIVKKTSVQSVQADQRYILMVITDKKSDFQRRIEQQIEERLKKTDYTLITVECGPDISEMEGFFRTFLESGGAAGALIFPDEKDVLLHRVFADAKIPVVILGREVRDYMADMIYTDTMDGAYKAARHLIKKGHERIGFLGRSRERTPHRLDGFKKALQEYGIPEVPEYIHPYLQKEQDVFDVLDRNVPACKDIYQTVTLPTKLAVRSSTCGIGRGPFGEKAASMNDLMLSEKERQSIRSKKATAVISFHYAGKAWMELHLKGIRNIFDSLGISIIGTTDAHFDPRLQCRQLESLRMLEPDILIAMPTDNKITADAFRRIADSGIRLILISNVPDGLHPGDYVTCVSINEHSHGQNMGHGLGEYMSQHNLKHYGMIVHGADFYATAQRDNAAKQVLGEECPSLHLCGSVRFGKEDEVYQKAGDLIRRYPEIEALYISWDGPAMEVIAALTELGRTDIAIVTSDLDYADAVNMARGGMIKALSAQCPYEQGQAIALAAARSILNKEVPSFIGIESISVTSDNLLKSWKKVFKEEPRQELLEAFKENPNYVSAVH